MSYFTGNKTWAIVFLLLIALNVATLATFWLVKERRPGPPPAAIRRSRFSYQRIGF
jgi:uncharacterized protein YpmS